MIRDGQLSLNPRAVAELWQQYPGDLLFALGVLLQGREIEDSQWHQRMADMEWLRVTLSNPEVITLVPDIAILSELFCQLIFPEAAAGFPVWTEQDSIQQEKFIKLFMHKPRMTFGKRFPNLARSFAALQAQHRTWGSSDARFIKNSEHYRQSWAALEGLVTDYQHFRLREILGMMQAVSFATVMNQMYSAIFTVLSRLDQGKNNSSEGAYEVLDTVLQRLLRKLLLPDGAKSVAQNYRLVSAELVPILSRALLEYVDLSDLSHLPFSAVSGRLEKAKLKLDNRYPSYAGWIEVLTGPVLNQYVGLPEYWQQLFELDPSNIGREADDDQLIS